VKQWPFSRQRNALHATIERAYALQEAGIWSCFIKTIDVFSKDVFFACFPLLIIVRLANLKKTVTFSCFLGIN